MADYTEKVTLPSRGYFYQETCPEIAEGVTIRMMKTSDEKMVYGSGASHEALNKLLRSCIVSPKFNPDILVAADRLYLLIKLRIFTYGDAYKTTFTCPSCGKQQEVTFSFDKDVVIHELPDDFEEPIIVNLPLSKKQVGIRVLRGTDFKDIEKQAKKRAKAFNTEQEEEEFILRLHRQIVSIDGEDVTSDPTARTTLVANMMARDSSVIRNALNKVKLGYELVANVSCPHCGESDIDAVYVLGTHFFRVVEDD